MTVFPPQSCEDTHPRVGDPDTATSGNMSCLSKCGLIVNHFCRNRGPSATHISVFSPDELLKADGYASEGAGIGGGHGADLKGHPLVARWSRRQTGRIHY